MAQLEVVGGRVEVVLSQVERLGALRGDVSAALGEVVDVQVSTDPFGELRGIRAPGAGLPGVLALGTWRRLHGKDFVAVYRRRPAVIVNLAAGSEFERLVVGVEDADATAAALRAALGTGPARVGEP